MLVFTAGLKLKLKQLVQAHVIGGGLGHCAVSVAIFTAGIHYLADVDWKTALLLAIAPAFSSTVPAAKSLEAKRELGAFHGRAAVGILITRTWWPCWYSASGADIRRRPGEAHPGSAECRFDDGAGRRMTPSPPP